MGAEGWQPAHVLADHENIVTSVAACPLAMETFASSSLDHTIKVWNMSALPDKSSDCVTFKGAGVSLHISTHTHAHTHMG